MATLEEIKAKVDGIIEQNNNDITHTLEELEKSEQNILMARAKIVKAQEEIDANKYTEAKSELWTAEQTKEFHEKRLKTLKEDPLIPYDEFHNKYNEIIKLAEQEQKEFFDPAIEKLKEIIENGEKSAIAVGKVNDLLKELEGLSRERQDYRKTKDGAIISDYFNGLSYSPRNSLYGYQNKFEEIIKQFKS